MDFDEASYKEEAFLQASLSFSCQSLDATRVCWQGACDAPCQKSSHRELLEFQTECNTALVIRECFMVAQHRFGHVLAYPAVAGITAGIVEHRFAADH